LAEDVRNNQPVRNRLRTFHDKYLEQYRDWY
jgi:hypothetical protein